MREPRERCGLPAPWACALAESKYSGEMGVRPPSHLTTMSMYGKVGGMLIFFHGFLSMGKEHSSSTLTSLFKEQMRQNFQFTVSEQVGTVKLTVLVTGTCCTVLW